MPFFFFLRFPELLFTFALLPFALPLPLLLPFTLLLLSLLTLLLLVGLPLDVVAISLSFFSIKNMQTNCIDSIPYSY